MMWGTGSSAAWLWLGIALLAVAGVTALASVLARSRRPGRTQGNPAARELDERFARGDIGQDDCTRRRAVLDATVPARPAGRWHRDSALVITLAAIAGAGAVSVAMAATAPPAPARPAAAAGCAAAALPGQVVSVSLQDMRGMMGGRTSASGYPGGMMGGGYGPGAMMGGSSYPGARAGGRQLSMMSITADRASVPAGTVSFRVRNSGSLTHEMVVLPLPAGGAGTRPVGSGGTVSEQGSLGEASAACAAGAGTGISPGTTGWVTVHLAPGRYELICNLPGHYAMGMFTELDVR